MHIANGDAIACFRDLLFKELSLMLWAKSAIFRKVATHLDPKNCSELIVFLVAMN